MCDGLVAAAAKKKSEESLYHTDRLIDYSIIGVKLPYIGLRLSGIRDDQSLPLISSIFIGLTFIILGESSKIKHLNLYKLLIAKLNKLSSILFQQILLAFIMLT